MFAKEQRIGALVLFILSLGVWLFFAFRPSARPAQPRPKRTWEQIKDSMRHADSVRYALWSEEREQRYDSFRMADSIRRAELKRIRQQRYDSFRIADSLWRDSVGWRFTKRIKKDTVLDLNRTDTAELQLLRGIGPYTAAQIIRYREQLGGYYSPSQLTDEPLAQLRLDTMLHHFTADPSDVQTINVNTCPLARLQRHPYLRYKQAKAIYTLRRQRVTLHSLHDLRSIEDLPDSLLLRLAPYLAFD